MAWCTLEEGIYFVVGGSGFHLKVKRKNWEGFFLCNCLMSYSALADNFLKKWFKEFSRGKIEAIIC